MKHTIDREPLDVVLKQLIWWAKQEGFYFTWQSCTQCQGEGEETGVDEHNLPWKITCWRCDGSGKILEIL